MNRTFAISHSLFVILFSGALAMAQMQIDWHTIDGGGAISSTGGSFTLAGTIGQPDAQTATVMAGGNFELTGGFWPVAQVCYCPGDLTGDGKKDGRDIQQFVSCIMTAGNCSCADVDQANGVTLADVSAFVANLLAGPSCP